jgi:hypothetical protein
MKARTALQRTSRGGVLLIKTADQNDNAHRLASVRRRPLQGRKTAHGFKPMSHGSTFLNVPNA